MTNEEKARAWIEQAVSRRIGWEWHYTPTAVIPVEASMDALLAAVQEKGEMDRRGCADGVHTTYRDVPEPPR